MQTHRGPDGYKLSPAAPCIFWILLGVCQVMASHQQHFHEGKSVPFALSFFARRYAITVEGLKHQPVVSAADLLDRALQIDQQRVARRKIPHCERYQNTYSAEHSAVPVGSALECNPTCREGWLIDMPVDPIAVLEVIPNETIDDVHRGQKRDQVFIVDGRRTLALSLRLSMGSQTRVTEGRI